MYDMLCKATNLGHMCRSLNLFAFVATEYVLMVSIFCTTSPHHLSAWSDEVYIL